MEQNDVSGILVFKGMKVGFLEGDFTIGVTEEGQLESKAILSTSYNVLPLWLRIARDNVNIAKTAFDAISSHWHSDPDAQKKLLLAELSPAIQTIVACGIAYDALYEQIRPFSKITPAEIASWKKNRTSRASQISEVIRRVYKLSNAESKRLLHMVTQTTRLRDLAVHPSDELKQSRNRPDLPISLDWRFCAYRYENALNCYNNIMGALIFLRDKTSPEEGANANMENIFASLEEMGLVSPKEGALGAPNQ